MTNMFIINSFKSQMFFLINLDERRKRNSLGLQWKMKDNIHMEKQNIKNAYLQYFPQKTILPRPAHPSRHSKRPQPHKLLPHIQEEYQYRITNHLLIKKIIYPKRDKLILNSLLGLKRHKPNSSHSYHAKSQLKRTQWRQASLSPRQHHRSEHRYRTTDLQKQEYSQCLTTPKPKRVQSRAQLSIFRNDYQQQAQSQAKGADKGHDLLRCLKINKNEHFQTETYGMGPTILSFSHIQVTTSPPLKAETLMQLQLVERIVFPGQQGQQKVVRTHPIAYNELPREEESRSKVKFALKISKIGDFVPMRVWKYAGVQSSQVGTVDIPLSLYRLALSGAASFADSDNIKWQGKQGTNLGRLVVTGQISCQLKRGNTIETQAKVFLRYKVYPKRFSRPKEVPEGMPQE